MTRGILRDKTGVLDFETQDAMLGRFNLFHASRADLTESEALSQFLAPAEYEDYMQFSGKRFTYTDRDGKQEDVIFDKPYYCDSSTKKKKTPESAIVHPKPRFGTFAGPVDKPYPVDSDLRIRCDAKIAEPKNKYRTERSICISLNELKNLCATGRDAIWSDIEYCDDTNQESDRGHSWLNSRSSWFSDPLYRETPDGQQKVDEILSVGMKIRSNYSETIYIIASVEEYFYKAEERPEGANTFSCFYLSLINEKTRQGGYSMSSLVALDNRILKLFYASTDEIFIISKTLSSIEMDVSEDEDDCDNEWCDLVPSAKIKKTQLTLF
jgi:hypothetical protein